MSKKKQDVLQTAETLFYAHGFHAVGIKKIIAEANVSLMTLYNHFESKENLVLEVLTKREERYFSFLQDSLKAAQNQSKDNVAYSLAQAHINWLETSLSKGCLFLRAKEEYASENQEIVNQVNQHKHNLLTFFKHYGLSETESLRLALLTEGATSLTETTTIHEVKEELLTSVSILFQI